MKQSLIFVTAFGLFLPTCRTMHDNDMNSSQLKSSEFEQADLSSPIEGFVATRIGSRGDVKYPVYLDNLKSHQVEIYTPWGNNSSKPRAADFMDLRLAKALTLAYRELYRDFGLRAIEHWGIYVTEVCRPDGTCTQKTGTHPLGLAIDIARLKFEDGADLLVSRDWLRGKEPDENTERLVKVRDVFCKYLHTVLNPYSNSEHADHYHVDLQPYNFASTELSKYSEEFNSLEKAPSDYSLTESMDDTEIFVNGRVPLPHSLSDGLETVIQPKSSDTFSSSSFLSKCGCDQYYNGPSSSLAFANDILSLEYKKKSLSIKITDPEYSEQLWLSLPYSVDEKLLEIKSQNERQSIRFRCSKDSPTESPCTIEIDNIDENSTPFKMKKTFDQRFLIIRSDNDTEYYTDVKNLCDIFKGLPADDSSLFPNGRDPDLDVRAPGQIGFDVLENIENPAIQLHCRKAAQGEPDGFYFKMKIPLSH